MPSEESPPSSNQPTSPKSPQKAAADALTVEEQKSPQTRVLRSSNRSGSNSSGAPSRGTSPTIPDEQIVQSNSPAAVTADAVSTNTSPATRSEQTENVSVSISGDDKQAFTAVTTSTTSTTTSESMATTELSGIEIHPKRRKIKSSRTESETSDTSTAPNVTAVETNPSGTTSEPPPVTNCYQMFLNIRKQVSLSYKSFVLWFILIFHKFFFSD